jgi:hypothetical protein
MGDSRIDRQGGKVSFQLVNAASVVESEIAAGLQQKDIALTYALAMRSEDGGEKQDWPRMNNAILARWPKGLERVKTMAWKIAEGKAT